MRWVGLLPSLVLWCGCSLVSAAPQSALPAWPGVPSATQVPFIAWVEVAPEGSGRAVVYYPQEDRQEVLATSEPGETPLAIHILPSLGRLFAPTTSEEPQTERGLYLDSGTGQVLQPPAVLGLEQNPRRVLIDLVGDRAVVLEHEQDAEVRQPTAKLYLFRGETAADLGRVYVESAYSSAGLTYYGLNATRRYLTWSGPDGNFRCDLETGEVRPQERRGRWLPDGVHFLTQSPAGADRWRWQLTDADSLEPVATGEGLIAEVSPDGTYWTIHNEDPDHDPPRFLQVVPGSRPSATARLLGGSWVIDGTRIRFFTRTRDAAGQSGVYRITLSGYQKLPLAGDIYGQPEVLSRADGGRVALFRYRKTRQAGLAAGAGREVQLVILDFSGQEKLHTTVSQPAPESGMAGPLGDYVCVVDQTPDGFQVKRVNYMTGQVETVLQSAAEDLHMARVGSVVVAQAWHSGGTTDAHWELFVGRQEGQQWQPLAQYARDVQWRP